MITGSGGGHTDQVRIELLYLSVTQVSPPCDTRNVDLAGLSLEAVFNREVDFATVSGRTFRVTSIDYYAGGVPCEYRRGLAENSIACDLSLANPATDPHAQQGLALDGADRGWDRRGPHGGWPLHEGGCHVADLHHARWRRGSSSTR